ncbi:hypothetical protein DPMN_184997 [Dreissena polymorpha]|uniref:Uncharacterized protein n=1 Tax=Dreissena polymorpha TaxID=45954 RepID=A0A9D4I6X9_DREPO|nr:hypothetical protein DPMN_184997 [Dreissena polymorpha]
MQKPNLLRLSPRWLNCRSSTRRNRTRKRSSRGRLHTPNSCWTGPLNWYQALLARGYAGSRL